MRLKTVEIVVEEKPWQPPFRFLDADIVPIPVSFEEKAIREHLKAVSGKWDPLTKVWLVPYRIGGNHGVRFDFLLFS